MVFTTSAMSCYIENSIKNGPNIDQKTALKPTLQLGSILEPTWLHFGRVLGSKMRPSWTKSLQKSIFKSIRKIIMFRIALGTDFSRFWAPTWLPRGGPRNHFWRFFGLLEPSWGQDGPKTLPRAHKSPQDPPKTPPRGPLGAMLGPKLVDFRPQVDRFCGSWHPNSQAINQPFNQPTIQPTSRTS